MKKYFIYTFILSFTVAIYPQGDFSSLEQKIKLENVISSTLNSTYLNKMQVGTVSPTVLNLQNTVALFNLSKSSIFKGSGKTYRVNFRKSNGKISAIYDGQGKILESYGRFTNVIFPIPVRNTIFNQYPGWYVLGSVYNVFYTQGNDVRKVYKIQIGNGVRKKNLKINQEGNLL
ncbi:hypothetical protein JQC67_07515 [Aurantibacter crassamenti]|uniref:hypothetical protein n=1 Tax=Aurantibacter crassamenti TaxID=1837375 RepID=UPI00193A3EF6|nr:hypothetical protein [Aurantibacter crassamenti]MBM1105978.1 hypothetical protein [Aurantibacter crassamenti]